MASFQSMKWTPAAHEDILVALIQNLSINACDWVAIMGELRARGYTFSKSALRQHLQRLRRNRDNGGPSTPKTPQTPRTPRNKEASCKRNVSEIVGKGDGNGICDEFKSKKEPFSEDEQETPSKKVLRLDR